MNKNNSNSRQTIASQEWYQDYTRFALLTGLAERTRETYYGKMESVCKS